VPSSGAPPQKMVVTDDRPLGDEIHVLAFAGELDLDSARAVKERVTGAMGGGARRLLVDVSEVDFIHSTTLGVLIGSLNRLERAGGLLAVVCTPPRVRLSFRRAGLERDLGVCASREEALGYLRGHRTSA
jgi:anti-sigma B factor antagonist